MRFQVVEPAHGFIDILPVDLVKVAPEDRFGIKPAGVTDLAGIDTGVDGVIISQLTELPDHFWPRQRKQEYSIQFHPVQRSRQRPDIVTAF